MPIPTPRRISLEATREFQEIYKEEFGELLSDEEAQQRAVEILGFFGILTKPVGDRLKSSH